VNLQIPGLSMAQMTTSDQPTEVLCLMNMITEQDLEDEEEYEGIFFLILYYYQSASVLA